MSISKSSSIGSPRLAVATGLRQALAAWEPPAAIRTSIRWISREHRPEPGRIDHARIKLTHREVTRRATEQVTRHQRIAIEISGRRETDLAVVVAALDEVVIALSHGVSEARRAAEDRGFRWVNHEEGTRTSPRSPWEPQKISRRWKTPLSVSLPDLVGMVFRRVPGWPKYDVSASGVVRSYHDVVNRTIAATPQRVLTPKGAVAGGGRIITLYDGRFGTSEHRHQKFTVAQLVDMTWLRVSSNAVGGGHGTRQSRSHSANE